MVAGTAVGCGDSLDWSIAHINIHLLLHFTKMRRMWISASDSAEDGGSSLRLKQLLSGWEGGVKRKQRMQARNDSKFYLLVTQKQ